MMRDRNEQHSHKHNNTISIIKPIKYNCSAIFRNPFEPMLTFVIICERMSVVVFLTALLNSINFPRILLFIPYVCYECTFILRFFKIPTFDRKFCLLISPHLRVLGLSVPRIWLMSSCFY
jgi:hypothetical protein